MLKLLVFSSINCSLRVRNMWLCILLRCLGDASQLIHVLTPNSDTWFFEIGHQLRSSWSQGVTLDHIADILLVGWLLSIQLIWIWYFKVGHSHSICLVLTILSVFGRGLSSDRVLYHGITSVWNIVDFVTSQVKVSFSYIFFQNIKVFIILFHLLL